MNLPIEKLVGIIILLIVLIAVVYLFVLGNNIGRQQSSQADLQQCCSLYRANSCDFSKRAAIFCPSGKPLETLVNELSYSESQLNSLCGCRTS